MRLDEADAQEERPILHAPERCNRLIGGLRVGVQFFSRVGPFKRRPAQRLRLLLLRQLLQLLHIVQRLRREPVLMRLRMPRGLAPRLRIVAGLTLAVVKDLAERQARVAVVLEMLRQRDDVGQRRPQELVVRINADGRRPQAAQHAVARRIANRHLAIGPLEPHGRSRQRVDPRGVHVVRAVAFQLGPQIVDGDEENVEGFLRVSGLGWARAVDQGAEQK